MERYKQAVRVHPDRCSCQRGTAARPFCHEGGSSVSGAKDAPQKEFHSFYESFPQILSNSIGLFTVIWPVC